MKASIKNPTQARRPVAVRACLRCVQQSGTHARPLHQRRLISRSLRASSHSSDGADAKNLQLEQQEVAAALGEEEAEVSTAGAVEEEKEDTIGVKAALAMLRVYKGIISPILPQSCRFLPTCSVYAMDAYKTYGVAKGTVLTAWRLARCNPFGGSGYDPVQWPPPKFR